MKLSDIIYAGTKDLSKTDVKKGTVLGVNMMCVVIILVNLTVGTLNYLLARKISILYGCFIEIVIVASVIVLNYKKKYDVASITFFVIINLATFYFTSVLGQSVEAQLMIVYLIGLAIFLFEKKWTRILCICLSLLLLVFIEINFRKQIIASIVVNDETVLIMRWCAYIVISALVILLFHRFSLNEIRLRNELELSLKKEVQTHEEKNMFLRNITHEINSQNNAIASVTYFMKKNNINLKIDEANGREILLNSSNHLYRMATNIMELTKHEAGHVEPIILEIVEIRKIILTVIEEQTFSAHQNKKTIVFDSTLSVPEVVVTNEIKIYEIISNLISNAVKFAQKNTVILVHLFSDNKGKYNISVINAGEKIDEEKMKTLFDAFVTLKGGRLNPRGIGIGLCIVQRNVSLLGGTINVLSDDSRTSFTVILPINL